MANTFITPTWVMKETGRLFVNNLKFAANVNRSYDDAFSVNGAKVGYTVNARLPQRFRPAEGQALQLQALQDSTVPISLTHQKHIGFGWSTADRTVLVQEVRDRYIRPAASSLANIVDFDGLQTVTRDVWQSVGTPGSTPTTNLPYLQATAKLAKAGVPTGNLVGLLDPTSQITLVNANFSLFNGPSRDAFRTGQFSGQALGVDEWYMDQNIYTHTYGTYSGSPVVNGAGQTGNSLVTSGWGSGVSNLKRGDVFTIAGVYAVNSMNYSSTGQLQNFVVTSDVNDTTGAMTIGIAPSIITSGAFQTVDSSPANNAVITVFGASATVSTQALIYDRDAFALVMADLYMPDGTGARAERVRSRELGISIRFVQQYQIGTDQEPSRLDILYGWATIRPEMAVRVQSGA